MKNIVKYLCTITEKENIIAQDLFDSKVALESLARQLTDFQGGVESDLYSRLIEDYKDVMKKYKKFWEPYYSKYDTEIEKGEELSLDFATGKMYIIKEE